MTAAKINTDIDESLARIDSQDNAFIHPIRQYLEAHGCTVTTGSAKEKIPIYHIAAGDEEFVKTIFLEPAESAIKRLALVIDGISEDPKNFFHATHAKIVLLPAKDLGAREVETIFAFFFTSAEDVLNLLPPGATKKIEKKLSPAIQRTREQDEDRISQTMQEIFQKKETVPVKKHAEKKGGPLSHILIFLFITLCLPVLWYFLSFGMGIGSIGLAGKFLSQGNISLAQKSHSIGGFWISQGKSSLNILGVPFAIVGDTSIIRKQERLWDLLSNLHKGLGAAIFVAQHSKDSAQALLANDPTVKEGGLAQGIETIRNDLFLMQNHLGLAQGELKELLSEQSFPFSLSIAVSIGKKTNAYLTKLRSDTEVVDNLLSLYQKLAGFTQKKTYLLLFQNSMELRPTGGFIGSVGLATFTDGKLTDLQIQDVYTTDGQLKGHVDPPKPIWDFLGQEHWYLRDSNWDPDFTVSGPRAGWFYEKEMGIKVDGVFAINVPVIQSLLQATGPISLSDYNDRITAENFFGKSLYYTQNGFFPGSTQKKDFLGTLTNAIIEKLTTQKGADPLILFRTVANGLSHHDILFSFTDPQLEALAVNLGWGGVVPQKTACGEIMGCFLDYFYSVDANLSVNKVNYFLKRNIIRQITIGEEGIIRETVTMDYQNTSTGDGGGGGNYRNFGRFYVPGDSRFTSVTIDGTIVHAKNEDKNKSPELPYTETQPNLGNTVGITVAFDVPPATEKRLVISYERKTRLLPAPETMLSVYTQRQPGTIQTQLQTSVSFPIFWTGVALPTKSVDVAPKQAFLAKEAQFEYNTDLLADRDMQIRFTK